MNKLVSVIIPIYNVSSLVERCVRSVMAQTYGNLEIILVDDGSTDNSGGICDNLSNEDSRIVVFHKKNGGLSDARNFGIEQCKGEYISFIDGDDYIHSEYIERLCKALEQYDTDFSQCTFAYAYDNGLESSNTKQDSIKLYNKYDMVKSFLESGANGIEAVAWGKLYKREVFSKIRYPKGRLHEDMFTTCDVVLSGAESAVVIDQELYYYYQRTGSISKSFSPKRLHDSLDSQIYIHEKITAQYPDFKKKSEYMLHYIITNIINENLNELVNCDDDIIKKLQENVRKIHIKNLLGQINNRLIIHLLLMKLNMKVYLKMRTRG